MKRVVSAIVIAVLLANFAVATDFAKSPEIVACGKALFFEKKLSATGTISCATCHDPEFFYTDGLQVASGNFGKVGTRNSPTIGASSDSLQQFHDGRTIGTPLQATQPLTNVLEMGDTGRVNGQGQPVVQTLEDVMNRLRRDPKYVVLFAKAFPDRARTGDIRRLINPTTYGIAVAAFEERTKSRNAPVDKRMEGYKTAFSGLGESARKIERGYQIFVDSGCMNCHSGEDFTDGGFHNNGATFFLGETGRDSLGRIAVVSDQLKRVEQTRQFKTPTLREISLTGPYMHNGRVGTLREVLDGYNTGWAVRGSSDRFIDPLVRPLNRTSNELDDLEAFLVYGMSDPLQGWKITEPK